MLERTLKRRFPLCLSWQWLQLLLLCLCPSVTVLGQQCFDTGDCLDPAVLEDSHDAVTESTTSSSDSSSSIPDVLVLLCTQSFTGEQLVDEFLVDALAGQNNVRIQLVDEAGIDWAWKSDDQHHLLDETDQSTTQLLLSHRAKSILFVASTYGDGDPPNHALEFADWLLSSATSTTTSSEEEDPIPFAVFGLGDHAYQHFCIFAKLIDETLAQRGGRRLLPLQTADAQQGDQAGHFAQWTQQIVQVLQDQQILAPAQASSKQTQSQQQWTVPFASTGMDWRKSNRDPTYTNLATFHSATELLVDDSNNSNRSVLHVEFHIPKSTCQPLHVCQQLQPGDHLGIYPRNSRHTVQTALQWLLLDDHNNCQTTLAIRDNDNNKWIPHPINAYDFLAAHVDLAGRATPSALRALLPFVGTLELRALARDLTHVSTTATTSNDTTNTTTTTNTTLTLFDQWLAAQQNPFMTKLELAMVFECRPSLQALARALGPIQPRLYSIATVNQHDDSTLRIGICMAVAERGLATNFIAHMAPSALVAVLLRQSKFHYGSTSDHVNSSTLLVAAGTGIGPYIGFLQQQQQQQQQQHPSNAPIRLVYGARYPSDVLYRNELEQLLLARPAGLLLPLEAHVVFSRVPPRQHVQDVLLQPNMTAVLWKDVFVEAGRVFACGRLEICDGVKHALAQAAVTVGGMSLQEATLRVQQMEQHQQLLTDCWSVESPPSYNNSSAVTSLSIPHTIARLQRHHGGASDKENTSPEEQERDNTCTASSDAESCSNDNNNNPDLSNIPEWPSYLRMLASGEFDRRLEEATNMFTACVACGRFCEVDRLSSDKADWGECRIGQQAIVSAVDAHFGEEPCLRGVNGSGTIFFGACNLKCIYCQNWKLSAMDQGEVVSDERLADYMLHLQERGCHNINFVSPTHNILPLLRGVYIAAKRGLRLPIVFNSGGYDSVASLRLLEGIIDIYMPDAKYSSRAVARKLSKIDNYVEINQAAIKEMHRQVGDLQIDPRTGLAYRGLLVRHLVLPNDYGGTHDVADFLFNEISQNTYTHVMKYYRPEHEATDDTKYGLNRRPSNNELAEALKRARFAGLNRILY